MKKCLLSLIIPIIGIAFVVVAMVNDFGGVDFFILGPICMIVGNIAAIILIFVFKINLKNNLLLYILLLISEIAVIIVSWYILENDNDFVLFILPLIAFAAVTFKFFTLENKQKCETLVWILLNPNLYYLIFILDVIIAFSGWTYIT